MKNAKCFFSTAIIRGEGAPPGAAAPVVMDVWGHQPPSYISWRDFQGNSFEVT
jgi:hypothetical protein